MAETSLVPWLQVAVIAAGMVAVAAATRSLQTGLRVAFHELDYRAGEIDHWFKPGS